MKSLIAIIAGILLSACASTPPTSQSATSQATTPPTTPVSAPAAQYPAWLEMKPGYAETCISGGGCVPMTQAELQEMANDIVRRTMQMCRRATSI